MASLGHGEFGSVVHVRHLLDRGESAIKMTAEGKQLSDADAKRCLFEAQVMQLVCNACPSALQHYDTWIESMAFKNEKFHRIFLRMELCGRNLASLKKHGHHFNEQTLQQILNQVSYL